MNRYRGRPGSGSPTWGPSRARTTCVLLTVSHPDLAASSDLYCPTSPKYPVDGHTASPYTTSRSTQWTASQCQATAICPYPVRSMATHHAISTRRPTGRRLCTMRKRPGMITWNVWRTSTVYTPARTLCLHDMLHPPFSESLHLPQQSRRITWLTHMLVYLSTQGEVTSDVPYRNSSNLQPLFLCHDWHVTLGGGITPRYALILCHSFGISRHSTCATATCLLSKGPTYGDSTLLGRSLMSTKHGYVEEPSDLKPSAG